MKSNILFVPLFRLTTLLKVLSYFYLMTQISEYNRVDKDAIAERLMNEMLQVFDAEIVHGFHKLFLLPAFLAYQ